MYNNLFDLVYSELSEGTKLDILNNVLDNIVEARAERDLLSVNINESNSEITPIVEALLYLSNSTISEEALDEVLDKILASLDDNLVEAIEESFKENIIKGLLVELLITEEVKSFTTVHRSERASEPKERLKQTVKASRYANTAPVGLAGVRRAAGEEAIHFKKPKPVKPAKTEPVATKTPVQPKPVKPVEPTKPSVEDKVKTAANARRESNVRSNVMKGIGGGFQSVADKAAALRAKGNEPAALAVEHSKKAEEEKKEPPVKTKPVKTKPSKEHKISDSTKKHIAALSKITKDAEEQKEPQPSKTPEPTQEVKTEETSKTTSKKGKESSKTTNKKGKGSSKTPKPAIEVKTEETPKTTGKKELKSKKEEKDIDEIMAKREKKNRANSIDGLIKNLDQKIADMTKKPGYSSEEVEDLRKRKQSLEKEKAGLVTEALSTLIISMVNSNISESAFVEILELMSNDNLRQKAVEKERNDFNAAVDKVNHIEEIKAKTGLSPVTSEKEQELKANAEKIGNRLEKFQAIAAKKLNK